MTQKLCKTYQYQETEEEQVETRPEQEHDNEANEMMGFIMSLSTEDSLRRQELSTDTEQSDNDNYWSEDEYAVIKAYYENEQEDEEEELETRNLIKILKERQALNGNTTTNQL